MLCPWSFNDDLEQIYGYQIAIWKHRVDNVRGYGNWEQAPRRRRRSSSLAAAFKVLLRSLSLIGAPMREQKDRIPIADTDQIGLRDRSVQSDEMTDASAGCGHARRLSVAGRTGVDIA